VLLENFINPMRQGAVIIDHRSLAWCLDRDLGAALEVADNESQIALFLKSVPLNSEFFWA
jgi:hypothetical protein